MPQSYEYESLITCPYCEYEDQDSWEFGDCNGTHTCKSCGKEFDVKVHISVSYSSYPRPCKEHDYKITKWQGGDGKYYFYKQCKVCKNARSKRITKEEYDALEETD